MATNSSIFAWEIPRIEKPGGLQCMVSQRVTHDFATVCMHAHSLHSCPTLCNPMDCSPPGSSDHGILQARILDSVVMPSSWGYSQPRYWTRVSCVSCIVGRFFTTEPLGKPQFRHLQQQILTVKLKSISNLLYAWITWKTHIQTYTCFLSLCIFFKYWGDSVLGNIWEESGQMTLRRRKMANNDLEKVFTCSAMR